MVMSAVLYAESRFRCPITIRRLGPGRFAQNDVLRMRTPGLASGTPRLGAPYHGRTQGYLPRSRGHCPLVTDVSSSGEGAPMRRQLYWFVIGLSGFIMT